MRILAFTLICGMLGGGLSGCAADGNNRTEVGDLRVGGASRSVVVRGIGDAQSRPEAVATKDSASLDGLSRAGWEKTTVLVPVDGVEGTPRYVRERPRALATARQRGEHPTEMTALELSGQSEGAQWQESLASPWWNLIEVAALPVRVFMVEPWQETRHLPDQYWRAPAQTARQSSAEAKARLAREAEALRLREEGGRAATDAMDAAR